MAVETRPDAIVIGGGIAGLAAAAYLGRAGRRVVVLEKAAAPGGRAVTQDHDGFRFNLGAHALLRWGAAARVLRELDVPFRGGVPSGAGGFAIRDGRCHTLPVGLLSLLTTGLMPAGAKVQFARFFDGLRQRDSAALAGLTIAEWLDGERLRPEARQVAEAILRVSTYSADTRRQSASAALEQIQHGLQGVLYVDGGWQTLVDGLRIAAEKAGVRVMVRSAVTAVERHGTGCEVCLADGSRLEAPAVVIAVAPQAAAALLADGALSRVAAEAVPVRIATLDLALERLPRPAATFALGIDEPLYFSVHSAAAALAPRGGALVHVMRYLESEVDVSAATRLEGRLEELLDLVQPGWRDNVVHRRFIPDLVVSNALVTAAGRGAPRPGPVVPGTTGVFLAGDWVGEEGMLADAALASARRAALEANAACEAAATNGRAMVIA
jgi:phytoene dehydrogenase-like protein